MIISNIEINIFKQNIYNIYIIYILLIKLYAK